MKKLFVLFIALLSLNTCSNKRDLREGDCEGYPFLSVTNFSFDAAGGSQAIKHLSPVKYLCELRVDSVHYNIEYSCGEPDTLSTPHACYSTNAQGIPQLEAAWITLQWTSSEQLTLVVEPNTTGKSRVVNWSEDCRNCWQYLTVTQSAE